MPFVGALAGFPARLIASQEGEVAGPGAAERPPVLGLSTYLISYTRMDNYLTLETFGVRARSRSKAIKAQIEALRHVLTVGTAWMPVFVTLTYAPEHDYERGDITHCLNAMTEWARRRGFKLRVSWVAEPHQSGRPHYHLVTWVPYRLRLPKPDKQQWWKKGSSSTAKARAPWRYMAKYISKDSVISGMRSYGARGLEKEGQRLTRMFRAPDWLKPRLNYDKSDIRKHGAIWYDYGLYLWHIGPWEFVRFAGGALIFKEQPIQSGSFDAATGELYPFTNNERGVQC